MKININNISEGQIIKNYKMLCAELGIEMKKGGSRKLQLEDLKRYFDYLKDGHSFIIKEIYDAPIEKIDGRGKSEGSRGNNSVYGENIQFLIADLLVRQEEKHISISRTQLLNVLNMVNRNYGKCSQRVKELASMYHIEPYIIYDFYNTSNGNFRSAVETALKNLHDKRLLWYRDIVKVGLKDGTHRDATYLEEDKINRYELIALEETPEEFETVSSLMMTKHWKPFKERVNQLLNENTNIEYYYNAYFISIEHDYLEKERDKLMKHLLDDENRKSIRKELNQSVQSNLSKNGQKRHDNVLKTTSNMWKVRNKLEYPSKINQLVELLIDSKQNDISLLLNEHSNNKLSKQTQSNIDELFA
jgi:hypothetical protein